MKGVHPMARVLYILSSLLIACGAAIPKTNSSFDVRNIHWGMSVSQVKASEGVAKLQKGGRLVPFGQDMSLWYSETAGKTLKDGDVKNFCYLFHRADNGNYKVYAIRFYIVDKSGTYLTAMKTWMNHEYGKGTVHNGIYSWYVPGGRTGAGLHPIAGMLIITYMDRKFAENRY